MLMGLPGREVRVDPEGDAYHPWVLLTGGEADCRLSFSYFSVFEQIFKQPLAPAV